MKNRTHRYVPLDPYIKYSLFSGRNITHANFGIVYNILRKEVVIPAGKGRRSLPPAAAQRRAVEVLGLLQKQQGVPTWFQRYDPVT